MKEALKAKLTVELSKDTNLGYKLTKIKTNTEEIELDVNITFLDLDNNKMHVDVLVLGENFSLIQLPGDTLTLLGHKNVIVANDQLDFT